MHSLVTPPLCTRSGTNETEQPCVVCDLHPFVALSVGATLDHATIWECSRRRHNPDTRRRSDLAKAEPKRLRYTLLHTAGQIARTGRQTRLRVAAGWPWANQLVDAFDRCHRLRPTT